MQATITGPEKLLAQLWLLQAECKDTMKAAHFQASNAQESAYARMHASQDAHQID